jgi:DNA-cytosine methyltransferase
MKNVLSLFDGMRCGRLALERASIKVNKYYSSEINEDAIQIADKNYPQDIENKLGDVTKWREWDIDWSTIDLLIGGSPCQGFSFAGKQLNFEDPRSKLFFEYVNILNHIKKFNPNVQFLLENVKMKQEYQDIISEYLGVQSIEVNSNLVSAQNRARLYWTSILFDKDKINKKKITYQSILTNGITDKEKGYCLTLHSGNLRDYFKKSQTNIVYIPNENGEYEVKDGIIKMKFKKGKNPDEIFEFKTKVPDGRYDFRPVSALECERLQTVPEGYTEGFSESIRRNILGNGWTVDVITYILNGLHKSC